MDPFITAYRDSLAQARDANLAANEQAKANIFQQTMEKANAAGMLYSTFPERMKIQYTGDTFLPNQQKILNNYYTGMQSLRAAGANIANQVQTYEKALAELNAL